MKRFILLIGLLNSPLLAEQCQITSPLPVPVTINGCTFSSSLPNNSTSYIQNTLSPATTTQMFSVQTSSISKSETLGFLGGTQCLQEVNGLVSGTGAACGSGGGGGGGGVTLSSFTATQPILYNNATGAFAATLISLSTGVVGT